MRTSAPVVAWGGEFFIKAYAERVANLAKGTGIVNQIRISAHEMRCEYRFSLDVRTFMAHFVRASASVAPPRQVI
jgi:hypothetical protein